MSKCGHVNKHSLGVDKKPDNLACELDAGHDGVHQAHHFESSTQLSPMLTDEEQAKFEIVEGDDGKVYYEGYILRHWSDAAGVPAKDIKPTNPGEELINADHLFGVDNSAKMKDMQNEINELRALVKDFVSEAKEQKPKAKAKS